MESEENKKDMVGNEEEEMKGVDFEAIAKEQVYIPTLFEDDNFEFKVSNPQISSSHIVYNIRGVDNQGAFEG